MEKILNNKLFGLLLIGTGIIGFIFLIIFGYQLFGIAGFILPSGIFILLKSLDISKKKRERITTASFLISLALIVITIDLQENNELAQYGLITKGIIIDKKLKGNKKKHYDVTYSYIVKNDLVVIDKKRIGLWDKLEKGDSVDVIYSSKDNSISDIHREILNKPKRWSLIEALWKSDLGVKKVGLSILDFVIGIVILFSFGYIIFQILTWIKKVL